MKTSLIIITAVLLGRAGSTMALPPDVAATHKVTLGAHQQVLKVQDQALEAQNRAFGDLKKVHEKIDASQNSFLQLAQAAKAPPGVPEPPLDVEPIRDVLNNITWAANEKMAGMFGRPAPRKPLIVSGGERDAQTIVGLEEDLNVMARILEKTVNAREDRKEAMGIALLSIGASPTPRVMYLDGYGAVFMLNVKYPLLAPPKKEEQTKASEATSSEWEQAKAEVYGRADGGKLWKDGKFNQPEEFDAEQVERLKTQLVEEALVNATHIRNLKPNDYVTVVVLGGDSGKNMTVRREGRSPGDRARYSAEVEVRQVSGSAKPGSDQTTMTLRVKKSDVDEFAKDKTKVEDFRKKVAIQTY